MLHSAFPPQLLCERVPAFGTDNRIPCPQFPSVNNPLLAAEIASNHEFPSLKLAAIVLSRSVHGKLAWGPQNDVRVLERDLTALG
jgi:hypothetical protein